MTAKDILPEVTEECIKGRALCLLWGNPEVAPDEAQIQRLIEYAEDHEAALNTIMVYFNFPIRNPDRTIVGSTALAMRGFVRHEIDKVVHWLTVTVPLARFTSNTIAGVLASASHSVIPVPAKAAAPVRRDPFKVYIRKLNLSTRARNALVNDGVRSVGDLLERSDDALLRVPNFGMTSLREVKEALAKQGWSDNE